MASTVRSKKAKSRRLQNFTRAGFFYVARRVFGFVGRVANPEDIKPAVMSESGNDIKFFGHMRDLFPYAVECKAQEKINVHAAFEQAKAATDRDRPIPLVVFKRSHKEPMALITFNHFLRLVELAATTGMNISDRNPTKNDIDETAEFIKSIERQLRSDTESVDE